MATNDVITSLVRELRPVEPLPLPRVRTSWWAVAAGVLTAGAAGMLGLRPDLTAVASTPAFQVHALLLLVAALGSAAAALASAVPGEPMTGWRPAAPLLAVSGWCLWLGAEVWWFAEGGGAWWPIAAGWGCVAKAFAVGLAPGAVLTAMIARAAPPDLRRTCAFGGMAAAAVGAMGVEVTCPLTNPMHLLLWHAGPVVTAVVVVTLVATLVTRGVGGLRSWA